MTEVAPVQTETPAPPATPAEAATRLDQLRADPKWTSELIAGGAAQAAEFKSLHELVAQGDDVDLAMSGALPAGILQDGKMVEMANVAGMLRDLGIRDEVVRETLAGHTTTKAWHDEVVRWKADHMSNADWTKALMSGDVKAQRELTLANIILTGDIKEAKAA